MQSAKVVSRAERGSFCGLAGLTPDLLDLAACRKALFESLHPAGPACPKCNQAPSESQLASWWEGKRLACNACGKWYTAASGTPLQGSKLDCRQLVLIAACLGLEVDTAAVAQTAKVSVETVRTWRQRLTALESLEAA